MTQAQFTEAITAIGQFHSTQLTINAPKNGFVGKMGADYWTIHITKCVPAVVDVLKNKGYNLSMNEDGLEVDKH